MLWPGLMMVVWFLVCGLWFDEAFEALWAGGCEGEAKGLRTATPRLCRSSLF